MFIDHYKRFLFLKLKVSLLSHNPLCISSGKWGLGSQCRNADSLSTAVAVSHQLSSVSDPGIFYLLLSSMNVWQANLFLGKQGSISESTQSFERFYYSHFTEQKLRFQEAFSTASMIISDFVLQFFLWIVCLLEIKLPFQSVFLAPKSQFDSQFLRQSSVRLLNVYSVHNIDLVLISSSRE